MQKEPHSGHVGDMMSRLDTEIEAASSLKDLYTSVCDLAVGVGGYCMAWVGLAEDNDDKTILPMAHSGFSSRYIESIKISWSDRANGNGPTGTAIRTGKVQVVNDICTSPCMQPWCDLATKRGYNSCISLPLHDDSTSFGVISILARESERFDDDEVEALTMLSQKVSDAVARLRLNALKRLTKQA